MEHSEDDYDFMSDDELVGEELQIGEDDEEWKLIADIFSDRHHHALPWFTNTNPTLGYSSFISLSGAFKPVYADELPYLGRCMYF